MMKVGIRNGEVVIRLESERDLRLMKALVDSGWMVVTVKGEDVTEEVTALYEALGEIEWA